MGNLIASVVLILSFLGILSLGCIFAGVMAMFDGSPLWFAFAGLILGVLGLFCTHYHISLVVSAYRRMKDTSDD